MAEKDLIGISAPVGIAELAEVLCRSDELDLEVLFQNITSWNAAAHFQDDHEMGDVPNRLVGLIAEASHRSQWDRASVAVYALTGVTCLHMQGVTAALREDTLLLTKLQHSIVLAVAAFGEMLDDALLAGSQGASPSSTGFTEKRSLAELVRSLASLLLELLSALPALAEMLLAIPDLPGALLCAASTSPATLGNSSSLLSSSVSFVVLRAQRALADLLTSMLEETSTEVRADQELRLGAAEPGASRLVETLILSRPDPKLHQLLLELLWRALRRVPCPAGSLHAKDAAPAMCLFRELAGSRQQQQLQQVTGEQLLDWNLDLALQMNRHPSDVVSLSNCEVAWGSFRAHQCVVTFSSYSFVLEGLPEDDREAIEVCEVPWAYVRNPDLAVARGIPLQFAVTAAPLVQLGAVVSTVASQLLMPEAVMTITSSASETDVGGFLLAANRLFQGGHERSQDFSTAANTQDSPADVSSNDVLVTPKKTRSAVAVLTPGADTIVTPPPSQLTLERHGRHDGKTSCSQRGVALTLSVAEPNKVDAAHTPMRHGSQDLHATVTWVREDEVSHTGLKGMEVAAAGLAQLAATTSSASEHDDNNVPAENVVEGKSGTPPADPEEQELSSQPGGTSARKESQAFGAAENFPFSEQDRQIQAVETSAAFVATAPSERGVIRDNFAPAVPPADREEQVSESRVSQHVLQATNDSVDQCVLETAVRQEEAVAEAEDLQALTTTVQHANVVGSKSGTPPADPEEQELSSQPGGTSAGKESQAFGAAENFPCHPVSEQDRQIQAVETSAAFVATAPSESGVIRDNFAPAVPPADREEQETQTSLSESRVSQHVLQATNGSVEQRALETVGQEEDVLRSSEQKGDGEVNKASERTEVHMTAVGHGLASSLPEEQVEVYAGACRDPDSFAPWATGVHAFAFQPGLSSMALHELRKACEDLGLPSNGSKEALMNRLTFEIEAAATPPCTQTQNETGPALGGDLALPDSLPEPAMDTAGRQCVLQPETVLESQGVDGQKLGSQGDQEAAKPDIPAKVAGEIVRDNQEPVPDCVPEQGSATPAGEKVQLAEKEGAKRKMPPPPVPNKAKKPRRWDAKRKGKYIEELHKLTVKELRSSCREKGIDSKGCKAKLVERLVEVEIQSTSKDVEVPSPEESGLWIPPTRSPLRGGQEALQAKLDAQEQEDRASSSATQAAQAADAVREVVSSLAKKLGALPLAELRDACRARGLPASGSRSELVGRLAALAPQVEPGQSQDTQPAPSAEEVPASMEGLSLVALQAACRACGLDAAGDTADLTARLAVHAACEEPIGPEEETEELQGQQQIVETPTEPTEDPLQATTEPEPSECLDAAIADVEAGRAASGGAGLLVQPSEDIQVKEMPVTEQLDLVPSQLSIPAAQPDWPWQQGGAGASGSETVRSPVDLCASQPLDEGFRAGLRLLHTAELRHLCEQRGLASTGEKRELLNTLLLHFACAPQPTPTQNARSCISQQHQPAPVQSAPASAAVVTPAASKSKTKAASPAQPKVPPQPCIDPESEKSTAAQRKLQTQPKSAEANVSNMQTVQTTLVKEVEQLQPLKPVQRAPLAHPSLLRRQRGPGPGPAVAPNFSALWQSISKSRPGPKQRSENAEKADAGVGLTVPPPGMLPAHMGDRVKSRQTRSRRRTQAVGSCHAWTVAGAPCRNAGHIKPVGARFVYCARHSPRWPRFETVGVDELKPRPDSDSRSRKGAKDRAASGLGLQRHTAKLLSRQDEDAAAAAPAPAPEARHERRATVPTAAPESSATAKLANGIPRKKQSAAQLLAEASTGKASHDKVSKSARGVSIRAAESSASACTSGPVAAEKGTNNRNERKRAAPMTEERPGKRTRDKAKLSGLSQLIGLLPRSES